VFMAMALDMLGVASNENCLGGVITSDTKCTGCGLGRECQHQKVIRDWLRSSSI